MNPLKKAYCRVFQTCFKIAMPLLPYREPKQLDGIVSIHEVLENNHVSSVLLVTDRSVRGLGLTEPLEQQFRERGTRCTVYDAVVPNPTIGNVEEARSAYLQNGCQAIIAFGGGSPMDCAKGCAARIARPDKTIPQLKGILKIRKKTPLLIAIPTTAGTGSEATLAAVITDPAKKHKYPVNDFPLIPDYAILGPKVTVGLPPFVTATTGMDALTHAVEAYIGNSTTALTRAMSEEAAKLIYENIYTAYTQPENLEARKNMLRAAYCAGVSFTRSYVGYVHGVAHSLGGQYGVAHGLANAVILPYFLKEYGPTIYARLGKLARIAGAAPQGADDASAARQFIAWIDEINAKMGIPTTIPEIREQDIPVMAKHADAESNPLYPVPVLMDAKELEKMYYRLMPKGE